MNIKEIRTSKGISISFLANSISHISTIENGYRMPSLVVAIKIAKALNIGLGDLFKLELQI